MTPERTKLILQTLVKEYIKTAQPVSSGVLVEKYKLDISPATVRNELMTLEDEGYIFQPHTSAGRVPAQTAYELCLPELQKQDNLKDKERKVLEELFSGGETASRSLAKKIAELSSSAVFWAFHKNDLYYTGLSNLFSQPEFGRVDVVCDTSEIIDRLEEMIADVFDDLEYGKQVLIGSNNPFGDFLSTILVKYKNNKHSGLFGILGPMRMDYGRNLALAEFVAKKFIK